MKRIQQALARLGLFGLTAMLSLLGGTAAAQQAEATYIGEKACIECHGQESAHFKETLHSKVFHLNPRNEQERQVCETCHGPGSLHAKDTKNKALIIGFTKAWNTPIETQNGQCLSCHQGGNRLHWPGSRHRAPPRSPIARSNCARRART